MSSGHVDAKERGSGASCEDGVGIVAVGIQEVDMETAQRFVVE